MAAYCSSCNRSFGSQLDLDRHLALQAHAFHCKDCSRSFKTRGSLDQHMQDSAVHKGFIQAPSTSQTPTTLQSQSPKPNIASFRQPMHLPLPQQNAIASSSRTSQVASYGREETSQGKDNRWSVIPESQLLVVLQTLSMHCHSPRDLLKHQYPLSRYDAEDLVGLRRCKRCSSKSSRIRTRVC